MGDVYENIVRDEHMSDIAMAIRELLGPDSGMTLLDFPQKIREIKEQVVLVVNEMIEALCWDGECPAVARDDIISALAWTGIVVGEVV